MKLIHAIIVIVKLTSTVCGQTMDACPPIDPDCHPSCVLYTAEHCRICRCAKDLNEWNREPYTTSGSSDGTVWDRGFNGDWSSDVGKNSDSWSSSDRVHNTNSASGHSTSDHDGNGVVKYVVIEKGTDESYNTGFYSSRMDSVDLGSLFHGPRLSPSLLPGSPTERISASDIIHVPLAAPGQPQYCVRCKILNCPSTCERIDSNGCRSCPCAPSRFQTMPVSRYCFNKPVQTSQPDCLTTKLCIESCKSGARLGNIDKNGCRTCSCINVEPKHDGCPATLSCMLKCKDGYVLGETQLNGCPSCKCLSNSRVTNSNNASFNNHYNIANQNFNNDKYGNGGTDWTSGRHFETGITSSKGTESGHNGSSNGLGSGKCEPPMCIDGHMSIDEAMQIGTSSVGSAGGCSNGGKTSSSGKEPFSSSTQPSSGTSSFSSGFNMNFGSSGKLNGWKEGSTEEHTGSGRGMPSPFMSSSSGGGEKSTSYAYSPFAAAMSGVSPHENQPDKATNEHRRCPDLLNCLVSCKGTYTLGDLDENGCQLCSCSV